MEYFYFYSIITTLIFFLDKKTAVLCILFGGIYFLLNLPPTGLDYDIYKAAYETAYRIDEFPWFAYNVYLDAEPFYKTYSCSISVFTNLSFQQFLAFNFSLCFFLTLYSLSRIKQNTFYYFWIMSFPVIFPTLFYFSPRSSISYILILNGVFLFVDYFKFYSKKTFILSFVFLFTGITIHSQYILLILLLTFTFFGLIKYRNKPISYHKRVVIIISFFLFFGVKSVNFFIEYIKYFFSFLPSADMATGKLSYLDRNYSDLRLTSLLSIFVYPLCANYLLNGYNKSKTLLFFDNHKKELNFLVLIFALSVFGASINLSFFNSPHIAGRLSRLSDYLGFAFLIPMYFKLKFEDRFEDVILLILVVFAPLIYPSLYTNVTFFNVI